ncbi:hypothetical protein M422DRAFT_67735 [Sphaerobolus stellatus SS14]|uniref:Unplaced genomic scaffold SPHSTscaffold_44, whole genome shotgun sequence n=1 Tax=Sphaerobolus stellatus (strain SS14) TaxID=990650 RepID=A0A0C9VYM4_SPHS4|nr:hypothetical protein M422DRAFT_67735 [Sphaerobolus stellatus SS14]
MTDGLSLTQRWLRQNITAYQNKDIVYAHVDAVLAAYPTLRPKTDVYTYDDGRSQLMLCVHGLLPITYRRASYNIPVAVWLTHGYPRETPLVYVTPTSDMLVKASKHVDVSGLCSPPYIHAWQKKSEGCHLSALVDALVDQFSREPPVYAKPRTPDTSSRPAPPTPPRRPTPPPRPPLSDSPLSRSPPSVPQHPDFSRQQQNSTAGRQNFHSPARSSATPDPPVYFGGPPHHRPPYQGPNQQQRSASSYQPAPPHTPQYIPQVYTAPNYPTGPSQPSIQHQHQPPPPPLLPQAVVHSAPPSLPPPRPAPNLLEEDVDPSLPPPPPTAAPPRPPNPEILHLHAQVHAKLNAEFASLASTLAADMQRLQTAQRDLLAGEPAIRDEMARLEAVRDVCSVVRDRYRATVQAAESNLAELKRKGDPELDELMCSTTIVHNQLLDLVAEDNAIEDTLYHLHRALNAGRIDLDRFLRTTRSLAEEQFMKRALSEKISSSLPIGSWN